MIYFMSEDGYLMSVKLPKDGRCRNCGTEYIRDACETKPWQTPLPDKCPKCGYINNDIAGVGFRNRLPEAAGA